MGRGGLQRCGDQRVDLIVTHHPRSARPRFIEQPVTTKLNESVAPLTNCAAIQFQPIGQFDIATTFGGRQDYSGPHGQPLALLRRRVQPSNSSRSSSVNTICAACGDGITHTNKSDRINNSRH